MYFIYYVKILTEWSITENKYKENVLKSLHVNWSNSSNVIKYSYKSNFFSNSTVYIK